MKTFIPTALIGCFLISCLAANAVNNAPVLDNSPVLSLTMTEDDPAPAGTVGSLISDFTIGILDTDPGALTGIAVTSSDETHGTWYYSLDDGSTWAPIGAVSASSALLLADDGFTRLYFMPSADYNGTVTAGLTICAWDQTSGIAGDFVSTIINGGTTAFSTATDDIDVTVTAVNDAPTATNLNAAESYTEDTPLNLINIVASDIDNATVTATLTLSTPLAGSMSTATSGAVTSTYNAGTGVWTASGATADVNTLLAGAIFTPMLNYNSNFTISTSISDGALSVTGSKAMTGTAVNDAPTATNLNAAEIYTEDTPLNLINIVASDIDNATVTATLTLSAPSAGSLNTATSGAVTSTYNAGTGVWTATGATADVNTLLAGAIFTPMLNYNSNFTISTSVSDGALSVTGFKAMTGVAVNDNPTATNLSAPETYTEDISLNLTDIVAADVDNASLTATLTLSNPAAGLMSTATSGSTTSIYNAGTGTWTAIGATADVNALLAGVSFLPAANFNGNFTIATLVTDGGIGVTGTKTMTGIPVNDAPVLDNSPTLFLPTLTEDAPAPVGAVGAAVSSFTSGISDIDAGAVMGCAVISSDETNGTWYYTLDGGTTWSMVGAVSASSALLLPDDGNTRLYFMPSPDYNGIISAGLVFKAWDQSSGTAGGHASTATSGGTSAFSFATDNISVTVMPVNDAPVLDASQNLNITTTEDAPAPVGAVGSAISAFTTGITDVDAGAVMGCAITWSDETYGTWYYTMDGGTTWSTVGAVSATSALLLPDDGNTRLYFMPSANYNGMMTGGLLMCAWDQTSGTAGSLASTLTNGGTTAFSSAGDNISVTVLAVNDAPVLDASKNLSITTTEDAPAPVGAVGSDISAFTIGITDVDAGAVMGIAITSSDGANGAWYYTLDGGTTWSMVGAVSASSALLLPDDGNTRLYFMPSPDYNGMVSTALILRAWDQSSGTAGSLMSTTSNGGTTAFSTVTDNITLTVVAVNDAPNATNLNAAETYTENVPLDLIDIVAGDVDNSTIIATLILSDPAAGSLSTATSGATTSTFNAASGLWTANGPTADVNTLLSDVVFTPALNYTSNFNITTEVSDGTLSVSGTKLMTRTAVTGVAAASHELFDAQVYPNPFTGQFVLTFTTATVSETAIRIFDITGKVVQELREKSPSAQLTLGADLQSGIYFIRISQNNNFITLRVVKTID